MTGKPTSTRRGWIRRNLAALAGAGLASRLAPAGPAADREPDGKPRGPGMKFALMLPPEPCDRWRQAAQIGVRHAITDVVKVLPAVGPDRYLEVLARIRSQFRESGLTLAGLESHPIDPWRIRLGLPGRDDDIENYCRVIEATGKLGIPMICYNFMVLGWLRTRTEIPDRGGALTSGFDLEEADRDPPPACAPVSAEKLWENLAYFLRRVLPAAERAGVKMALHPDDPPVSPIRGVARILIDADAFRRVLEMAPSPVSGIAFCQANFKLMGEDIGKLIREFGGRKKIFFAHFRDVRGAAGKFVETFHDDGPTDMAAALQAYADVGFDGPIRPDHAPTLAGELNDKPGYAMLGKIFAIGYMKGIARARGIPVE